MKLSKRRHTLSRNSHPPPLVCAVDLGNAPSALVTQFYSFIYFIPFPSEGLQECGCPTLPLPKWLPRLGAVRLFLQLRSFASVLHVNDEPSTGACGKCISSEGKMERCSLCFVVTGQVWSIASHIHVNLESFYCRDA